jgi:ferrous iron transport protein B
MDNFTQLSAYAFMVFVLLYTPCVATIGVIKRETNSWKWTFFSLGYQIAVAWIVSFAIYSVGRIFLA